MENLPTSPTSFSYWVRPGQLLAGQHPGSFYITKAKQTLHQLLEAQVTIFIDLTEEKEYHDYERLAQWEASRLRRFIAYYRIPIEDNKTPSPEVMVKILDTIDTAVSAGRIVYLHCLHGTGRTGIVVGCYLVRHGLNGELALAEIARIRQGSIDADISSPRHKEQREIVLDWPVDK